MGCDIHLFVEKQDANGDWHEFKSQKYRWYNAEHGFVYTDSPKEPNLPSAKRWHSDGNDWPSDRNYHAFGILAGVRNKSFEPIIEPRGLPQNISNEIKILSAQWGYDGHSHSYYELAELLNFDWNRTKHFEGYLDLPAYLEFKAGGVIPWGYKEQCQIDRGEVRGITAEEADLALKNKEYKIPTKKNPAPNIYHDSKLTYLMNPYVFVEWEETYRHRIGGYFDFFKMLEEYGDPEKIRIVFWFDN